MRYLIIGAHGMAGHIIANYLIEQGECVESVARRDVKFCKTHTYDVRNLDKLKETILLGRYDYIINCIGILNTACDENIGDAIILNSYLPHFIAETIENTNTRLIQMSTDCVFSGKKGGYLENDIPDGETVYGKTKALGEINDGKNLTFRNSIIGPDINENGIGLFNWFMKQAGEVNGYEKSIWTGVTTLTLAQAIHAASKVKLTGIYNLVNNQPTNKYELLGLFNQYMNRNLTIHKVDGITHDKSLINTRKDFDFVVPSYEDQIKEMSAWINNHKQLYPHYFRYEVI